MLVSIIIPTVDEQACLGSLFEALQGVRGNFEIIVADGGSNDRTVEMAKAASVRVVHSVRGRGRQQAAAAREASGEVLWFLHADSTPVPGAIEAIRMALDDERVAGGNFTLIFDGGETSARQLTAIYPWLRWLGLCYGDSGIFVRRSAYDRAGGFRHYSLFEDVDLVRRIRAFGKLQTLSCQLVTSSRRFQNANFTRVFAHWTLLQVLFWMGVHPDRLARLYVQVRNPTNEKPGR